MCCFCLFTEISDQGEKYLDEQIENAVNGVKEMKNVMLKSSEDRQKLLDALEKTKEQKEVPNYTHTSVLMPLVYSIEIPVTNAVNRECQTQNHSKFFKNSHWLVCFTRQPQTDY